MTYTRRITYTSSGSKFFLKKNEIKDNLVYFNEDLFTLSATVIGWPLNLGKEVLYVTTVVLVCAKLLMNRTLLINALNITQI